MKTIFDRDYAVVGNNGRIWTETNDKQRAEHVAAELQAEGIGCVVVRSAK